MQEFYENVLKEFPPGIELAFAYGSGVFQQRNNNLAKNNMVDLIFVVKDPVSWHSMNLKKFPQHYSFLSFFGPDFLAKVQCNYGSKVYFNTLIEFQERLIKYGVISVDAFLSDLDTWETLYLSGRLHKPVFEVKNVNIDPFQRYIKRNFRNAVTTSMLLLPERFSECDLFLTIAGLSYTGDFRMSIGEDRNKIENIVLPNIEKFRELYKKTLNSIDLISSNGNLYTQDKSITATKRLLGYLPMTLQQVLRKVSGHQDKQDFTKMHDDLSQNDIMRADMIRKSVAMIVRKSSITQSLKGILTAGFGKSVLYSSAKITKMAKSLIR